MIPANSKSEIKRVPRGHSAVMRDDWIWAGNSTRHIRGCATGSRASIQTPLCQIDKRHKRRCRMGQHRGQFPQARRALGHRVHEEMKV